MKKHLFIFLFALMSYYIAPAQIIVPTSDSLTVEQYSTWLTQYYTDALGLTDWQSTQAYKAISKEKNELDAMVVKSLPGDKDKLWKKYYHILDSKFVYIFTDDQYKEYKHLNTIKINTVEVQ